jgi:hypothetical protein
MRLSNHYISRDLRSVELALRMLSHEARTHTVSLWTGISSDRVRKLSLSQRREKPQRAARRYRGPSQTQLGTVLTSPSLRSEAAAIAYICQMFEVMPAQPVENARATLPSVPRGEQVCSALEFFEALVPPTQLTFDQWVLLLQSLVEAKEWGMARCARCPALVVADRLALEKPLCDECQQADRAKKWPVARKSGAQGTEPSKASPNEPRSGAQLSLFDDQKKSG